MNKFLFILFLFPCLVLGQSRTIDSLKLALKNAKHDTTRCNILNSIGELIYNDKPDSAIKLWQRSQCLAEVNLNINSLENHILNTFKRLEAMSLNNLGTNFVMHGNLQKALESYGISLKLREEIGDKIGKAESSTNIGYIYNDQGNIFMALEYFQKSIMIYEEIGDKRGIATSLAFISPIYTGQGDINKALEYAIKSLQINQEIGNKEGIPSSLNNLGAIYRKQGDFPKALEYYLKSLKIFEENDDRRGMQTSLNNIGAIYDHQQNFSKALESYQKSLSLIKEMGNKKGIASTLNNIANTMVNKGDINKALIYSNKSMQISKELGFPVNIKNAANTLKQIYQKQNKYKDAFEMYELEIKMRDSINNQETQKAAIKKQMQYAYEKKELETKNEQDKKDIIAKEELKQKENERNYFMVGFGLVIVLALFIFRGYKQKQKANDVITEQKKLVDEKQKEILDSIHYAKRIQTALITSEKYIDKNLEKLNKN